MFYYHKFNGLQNTRRLRRPAPSNLTRFSFGKLHLLGDYLGLHFNRFGFSHVGQFGLNLIQADRLLDFDGLSRFARISGDFVEEDARCYRQDAVGDLVGLEAFQIFLQGALPTMASVADTSVKLLM